MYLRCLWHGHRGCLVTAPARAAGSPRAGRASSDPRRAGAGTERRSAAGLGAGTRRGAQRHPRAPGHEGPVREQKARCEPGSRQPSHSLSDAVPAQPPLIMEIENIVANTVLLKAREGERGWRLHLGSRFVLRGRKRGAWEGQGGPSFLPQRGPVPRPRCRCSAADGTSPAAGTPLLGGAS
ncbi:hypothetical protein NDU88_001514 [Pleurodeles waltl]|uniref:Uncharacterized protein n=1 Tax=Pleurodeles waltl TaxID=8319 RepID=A0AAV7WL41_PLEWA|nr:hypothetical protein NDU88_001514 [Pleurodeles waltl]